MHEIFCQISEAGIIPVVKIENAQQAVPLAKALLQGGIPCIEVTLRTPQALTAIANIAKEVPEMLLGAGTVLSVQQAEDARRAGAEFLVSPGLNAKVVAYCVKEGIPIVPGCSGPSDMELAMEMGLSVVKFFPAEQSGGVAYMKAVAGPYPNLRFIPTGGINATNYKNYLAFGKVLACGGSWMVDAESLRREDYGKIEEDCRYAVLSMLHFHLAHVGVNTANTSEALAVAGRLAGLFGFASREGASSVFAADSVELMKAPYLGQHGHLAIGVSSLSRGRAYLAAQGCRFREDSAKYNTAGELVAIYLEEEFAGFALHLVQG